MSEDRGTLQRIAAQLAGALRPLEEGFRDPEAFRVLLFQLGWDAPGLPPSYVTVADKAVQAGEALRALAGDAGLDQTLAVILKVGDVYRAVQALDEAPAGIDPAVFLPELGRRLFELLLGQQLLAEAPGWFATLEALGVIVLEDTPETAQRPGFTRLRFDWDQLPELLADPTLVPARVYGWGTPELRFDKLAELVGQLVTALGLPASLDRLSPELAAALQADASAPPVRPAKRALTAVLFDIPIDGTYVEVGLMLAELPAEGPALPGVILQPAVPGGIAPRIDLGDGWAFVLRSGTDLSQQLAVVIRPGEIKVRYPFAPGQPLPSGGFGISLVYDAKQPLLVFGQPEGTRLELSAASVALAVDVRAGEPELKATAEVQELSLVISPAGADGFLASVLGGQVLRVDLQFALAWSSRTGLDVRAGAGLAVTVFPHLDVGLVRVDQVDLAIQAVAGAGEAPALQARASAAFSGELGPVAFSVDRLGVQLPVKFADGNAGPFDVGLEALLPTGLGLVLDAAVVKGGGYLFMDAARGEYAGALELTVKGLGLKAIAILSTKMPDGSKGWSLLLLIYGQFPPIQLSWGFTLTGVGGMIGVQHGLNIEELKSGMRTGALDDILFPKNPVADAPRIINRLRAIFPATRRAVVVGPMVELGWGTPNLIQIRMALLFQLDNAFSSDVSLQRIILLGQLVVKLPPEVDDKAVVLKLLVDFYGYYDFDRNRLEFAARLHDSSVIKLPLSGMLFVRAEFGEKPLFILSAGGFHPRFKDLPADMPSPIDRLEVNLKIGKINVRAQQYFAITPASVQSGADIQVSAKVGPVDISGYLGYDAILYLEPRFFFEVDIRAGVAMKFHGHNLASVKLEFHLEGPGRWRAKGKASFSILFWDVDVHFDESWGDEPEIAPATTNVAQLMQKALSDKGNWRAQLPQGGESLVTLAIIEGDNGRVLAHPLGELQVTQKVAPLGLELQRFGSTQVDGANKFEVTQVTVGGQAIAKPTAATEFFARAQFVEMSDEQKLSAPSFEKFASGVTVGSADYLAAPEVVAADLSYETAYLQPDDPVRRTVKAGKVSLGIGKAELLQQAQHGAAAKSKLRSTTALRPSDPRKVKLNEPPLAVTNADTHTSAVGLDGLSQTATSLAEQTARNSFGSKAVGTTHVVVEAFELVK